MTSEDYQKMKDGYMDMVTQIMTQTGGLGPSITVLGTHKEDGRNSIVHIPILPKHMKDENSKDDFIDNVVPDIAKNIREKFDIDAVVWASEAWLRVIDTKTVDAQQGLGDWKSLPIKKEVLIITIESKDMNETTIKEIVRSGKQVNEDGDLVDHVELIDIPEYSEEPISSEGRFIGLYKKFTAN